MSGIHENGIDCSGLFVKAYRDQGQKIYHGSNTIFREYLSQRGKISNEADLQPGMAVFKWNSHTPEKFKDELGDFQHIGLVTSVSPLRIIHASSVAGRVICDTKVGKWKYWGWLKGTGFPTKMPADSPRASVTICSNGGKVNLRTGNGTGFHRITSVQPGTSFPFVAKAENGWLAVLYRKQVAWVSENYGKLNDSLKEAVAAVLSRNGSFCYEYFSHVQFVRKTHTIHSFLGTIEIRLPKEAVIYKISPYLVLFFLNHDTA